MYNAKNLPAKNGGVLKIAQDGTDQVLRVVEGTRICESRLSAGGI